MEVPSNFKNLGFLSDEVERQRFHKKGEGSKIYAEVRHEIYSAHSEIDALGKFRVDSRIMTGLLYWLRTLEACQGAALLADFGMQPVAMGALRTAFECLFASCAIWIRPATEVELRAKNLSDTRKIAKAVLELKVEEKLPPEVVESMKHALQAYVPNIKKASAEELAKTAGMQREYAIYWRTLGGAGAHPTEASISSFRRKLEIHGGIGFGPDHTAAARTWKGAIRCIRLGRERFQRDFMPCVARETTPE
ncbi:DUF5677 domain-containing protein [Paracidovorax avenae]|uniref:DUF5677 domain-containing protein n=1 Tax=Paracidovorax avenae TaxID=80867 RepID=UPI000A659EA6|nr:DUF5677 domain-containing protein [Paracidovorax avenae]